MEDNSNVFDFYNGGAEIGRLERGLGVVEFYRTKEIITQYIGESKLKICDIGGGIGRYSEWLAEMGHDVTMIELAPSAVEYAKKEMKTPYIAKAGDARNIDEEDSSFDVVLLMGPLYHLMNRSDRMLVLAEACRILKTGGLLIAAGISKYSSATWALSVYGDNGYSFPVTRSIICFTKSMSFSLTFRAASNKTLYLGLWWRNSAAALASAFK